MSTVPDTSTCEVKVDKGDDSIEIVAHPGSSDVNSNGLYVMVEFDPDLSASTLLEINISLHPTGDVPDSAQLAQSVVALVVDPSELPAHDQTDQVSGRIEIKSDFSRQGQSCDSSFLAPGTDVAIYEWGGSALLATSTLSDGKIAIASDGSGVEVCSLEYQFEGVPEASVYMVSLMPLDENGPCRACILGLLTTSESADQVFVVP